MLPAFLRTFVVISGMVISLAAVFGGMMLSLQPSGKTLGLSTKLLEPTLFENYFIPGLILMLVPGFYGWAVVAMTWLKKKQYPATIIIYGLLIIGWLTAELILNPAFYWPGMHAMLYILGCVYIVIGFILLKSREGNIRIEN